MFGNKKHKILKTAAVILFVSLAVIFINVLILYNYAFEINKNPSRQDYPRRGIIISYRQGDVSFKEISRLGIDFVYVCATDGGIYKDVNFEKNISDAENNFENVGLIHTMDFDFNGKAQADNFVRALGEHPIKLPPAVDIEGDRLPKDAENAGKVLSDFVCEIENKLGVRPVIICSKRSFEILADESVKKCCIWDTGGFERSDFEDYKIIFQKYTDRLVIGEGITASASVVAPDGEEVFG